MSTVVGQRVPPARECLAQPGDHRQRGPQLVRHGGHQIVGLSVHLEQRLDGHLVGLEVLRPRHGTTELPHQRYHRVVDRLGHLAGAADRCDRADQPVAVRHGHDDQVSLVARGALVMGRGAHGHLAVGVEHLAEAGPDPLHRPAPGDEVAVDPEVGPHGLDGPVAVGHGAGHQRQFVAVRNHTTHQYPRRNRRPRAPL